MGADMAEIYDCSDNAGLLTGTRLARTAIERGQLVVIPTDTVYGVAANAFDPEAVKRLLAAKGRGRDAPPPVLIATFDSFEALAEQIPPEARALADAFWPGGLTIIVPARSSLSWDLGDTGGTVALRMPAHLVTRELLRETGPLAVSSANRSGQPAAMTAADAQRMLGDSVAVYLDTGESGQDYADAAAGTGSTIVDVTATLKPDGQVKVVREGVIPSSRVFAVIAAARAADQPTAEPTATAADPPAADPRAADPPAADPPDGGVVP